MIVHGGEPPFVEEPNPRFGGLIKKLNEMTDYVYERTVNFNEETKGRLVEFNNEMAKFITEVVAPVNEHIASRGAQHGETKKTISLGLKDNFRTATLAEQIALANVDAFVTPQGAKQAIAANAGVFVAGNYQQNDVIQMASYFFPDEYPTWPPSRPEPVRYMNNNGQGGRIPMLLNGDRMVFSVRHDPTQYQRQSLYLSGPTNVARKTQLEEIQNVLTYYGGHGWNNVAGPTSGGNVGFFLPIADKNIYEFVDATGLPSDQARSYLLYRGYGQVVYKGMSISVGQVNGTQFAINHRFFQVDALNSNPTMSRIVDSSYPASFSTLGGNSSGAAQGSHVHSLSDFITLPAGATARIGGSGQGIVTSLFWNAQDYEAYLFVAMNIEIALANGTYKYLTLRFVESIIPGTLRAGGSAAFSVVGSRVKDVIPATGLAPVNGQWIEGCTPFNINSPSHLPGCVLDNGEVVKSRATKYGVRVKRYMGALKGLKAWVLGVRPPISMKQAVSETMVPARHSPFGPLAERIIPINHSAANTTYLVYELDILTGRYRWNERAWGSTSPVGAVAGNKFGIRLPDTVTARDNLANLPKGLVSVASMTAAGVTLGALAFTTNNGFKGNASVSYLNGTLTVGAQVSLSPVSLLSLQAFAGDVLTRAKAASPQSALMENARKPQIQVFAVTVNRAVFVVTDGLCHAEVGVAPYTITNGVFTLNFVPSNGIKATVVTAPVGALSGGYRESNSGDGVRMEFGDLMVMQTATESFSFTATRAFGDIYGDVSFRISSLVSAVQPTVSGLFANNGRTYDGDYAIDLVDELYPAFTIPMKGIYQQDTSAAFATLCKNVSNSVETTDPFDINETGWVRVPAGAKVVIGGRAYILDKDYAVKVSATGVSYCYLSQVNGNLVISASPVYREPSNIEVQFGVSNNGVLTINKEWLVLDRHLVSATRRGSAVPYFEEDGGNGPNRFFTQRDRI